MFSCFKVFHFLLPCNVELFALVFLHFHFLFRPVCTCDVMFSVPPQSWRNRFIFCICTLNTRRVENTSWTLMCHVQPHLTTCLVWTLREEKLRRVRDVFRRWRGCELLHRWEMEFLSAAVLLGLGGGAGRGGGEGERANNQSRKSNIDRLPGNQFPTCPARAGPVAAMATSPTQEVTGSLSHIGWT